MADKDKPKDKAVYTQTGNTIFLETEASALHSAAQDEKSGNKKDLDVELKRVALNEQFHNGTTLYNLHDKAPDLSPTLIDAVAKVIHEDPKRFKDGIDITNTTNDVRTEIGGKLAEAVEAAKAGQSQCNHGNYRELNPTAASVAHDAGAAIATLEAYNIYGAPEHVTTGTNVAPHPAPGGQESGPKQVIQWLLTATAKTLKK